MVINWLATHLVILSLAGFLFAAFHVFGPTDQPGTAQVQSDERAPDRPGVSAGEGASAESGPAGSAAGQQATAAVSSGREAAQDRMSARGSESKATGPRLIGGSLPVYGQHSAPSPMPGPSDDSFRPPADAPAPLVMSREDYLQRARRAFWNGDFEAAESAYMMLISAYPEDADAFGELGNLYLSMGKPDSALDAYYEAAVRLKVAGDGEKFNEIIELLRQQGDQRVDSLDP